LNVRAVELRKPIVLGIRRINAPPDAAVGARGASAFWGRERRPWRPDELGDVGRVKHRRLRVFANLVDYAILFLICSCFCPIIQKAR
jgi:hypothetical protein